MTKMMKFLMGTLAALAVFAACKRNTAAPRPTIPLVMNVVSDTTLTGLFSAAASCGAAGSIAIIGEPGDALALSRSFLSADRRDNVDGREKRDSLPDFAGETFNVLLDEYNAPYSHFITDGPYARERLDSLREVAVRNSLFAWDDARVRTPAKLLIFTSSLQAEYGLFDVDTLQQLTGGNSILLSPAEVLLDQAYASGARQMAVWTTAKTVQSKAWEAVFARKGWKDATLAVLSPNPALDIRTEFRDLLRKYRSTGHGLDVLLLDSYSVELGFLHTELDLIRRTGTEEDASFDRMLSPQFGFLEPKGALIQATYELLRSRSLFTHRIARPAVLYYQTDESADGLPMLEEVSASYVLQTYVQNNY